MEGQASALGLVRIPHGQRRSLNSGGTLRNLGPKKYKNSHFRNVPFLDQFFGAEHESEIKSDQHRGENP